MKKTNCGLMAVIALGGLIALAPGTSAQEKKGEIKPAPPAAPATPDAPPASLTARPRPDRSEQIAKFLELTDEQKAKVKPIMDEETKKFTEMREVKDIKPEDRRTKFQTIREATNAKMKPILTADQWEKWDKMRGITQRPQPATPTPPALAPAPTPAPAK